MKQMPQIQKYMTTLPQTIGKDISVDRALSMMREKNIRHLPVQDGGKLVGVLTDRDLKLASSLAGSENLTVEDVMTQDPYTAVPGAPLNHVIAEMAEHKYGSVVIQQENGKVVGIFTATDGLRVFSEFLSNNYKERT